METWQIEALSVLLQQARPTATLSEKRIYLHSEYFGESRYHVVTQSSEGQVIIDQTDHYEKDHQRISFEPEEVAGLLHTLLVWHLEDIRQVKDYVKREKELQGWRADGMAEAHPFADLDLDDRPP